MNSKIANTVFSIVLAAVIWLPARADGGSGTDYSPYSKFGVGVLSRPGNAYNRSMGSVGVAGRDHRYINVLNPAAVTARDTLAFMADFGVSENNTFFRQGDAKSVSNTFNINNFTMSFPIWRSSAFMVGISPFSSVAYKVSSPEKNPEVIGHTGNIDDIFEGTGSIYQMYVGAGVTFWKRLSVGAQFTYYFGTLEKYTSRTFSSSSYRSIYSGTTIPLKGFNGKFGLQYEQTVGKGSLVAGVTYRLATAMKGPDAGEKYRNGKIDILSTAIQSEIVDTLICTEVPIDDLNIPSELSVGLSYRHGDKWYVEMNYTRSDWSKSGMDRTTGFSLDGFSAHVAQSFNVGFEITPNRSDIRYYMRRCSYRAGAYYNTEYYKVNGNTVTSYGVTLGMTLPVFRWYNGVTVGVDLGQRGSLKNNLVRERYIGFNVSLNVFDIWFRKQQYE